MVFVNSLNVYGLCVVKRIRSTRLKLLATLTNYLISHCLIKQKKSMITIIIAIMMSKMQRTIKAKMKIQKRMDEHEKSKETRNDNNNQDDANAVATSLKPDHCWIFLLYTVFLFYFYFFCILFSCLFFLFMFLFLFSIVFVFCCVAMCTNKRQNKWFVRWVSGVKNDFLM